MDRHQMRSHRGPGSDRIMGGDGIHDVAVLAHGLGQIGAIAGTFAQRALVAGGALFIGFVVAFAGYDAEKKGEDRPDE